MSEPIKQHYVPQTYLNQFTFKKNTLYTFQKSNKKIFPSNIENVGAEKHFYTVEKLEDKYAWEKAYADIIEPLLGDVLKEINSKCNNVLLNNHAKVLDEEMKSKLAICIVYQLFRGQHCRNYIKNIFDDLAPQVISDIRNEYPNLDEEKEKLMQSFMVDIDYFKKLSMEVILDDNRMHKYANVLLNKCFIIYRIIGDLEFITSDNPIMFMDLRTQNVTPFSNGLLKNSTSVLFPISSKLLLAIYSPNYYFGSLSDYDKSIVFLESFKEKRFITNVNQKQIIQSYNQSYAKNVEILKSIVKTLE